jgi:pimeloyl-ACP methyl ester carboxylesterase
MGHPDMLRALERRLRKAGWHRVIRVGYPSHRLSLEQIAQRIDQAATPLAAGSKIDLVGHSLGAVACRAWLKAFGGHRFVRRFVSLGGPHGGTKLYRLTPPTLWPVLDPEGPWVKRLAEGPEPVPTTHIRARYDHQVLPPRPVQLDALEVVLNRVGHNGLLWSRDAHAAVLKALS